jgi:hypothetical protein
LPPRKKLRSDLFHTSNETIAFAHCPKAAEGLRAQGVPGRVVSRDQRDAEFGFNDRGGIREPAEQVPLDLVRSLSANIDGYVFQEADGSGLRDLGQLDDPVSPPRALVEDGIDGNP